MLGDTGKKKQRVRGSDPWGLCEDGRASQVLERDSESMEQFNTDFID